jgi:hypothetical protein
LLRFELRAIVQVDNLLIADMHNHVYFSIPVDIIKFKSDRDGIAVIRKKRRAGVNTRVGAVTTRDFDDDNVGVQIDRDKMRRMVG